MAYDEALAERVRDLIREHTPVTEMKMFGGLAFLVGGNMAVAASGQGGLLVRVDPAESESICRSTGATEAVMRGRPMPGWLRVEETDVATRPKLAAWVQRGAAYAATLPRK